LLSISHLDKEGWKVTFGGGKADFVDPSSKAQFTASMFNDLCKIDCELMRGDEYTVLAARSLEHSVPIETWHMQFAHFGVDRIKALSKGALVDGLNIKHKQQAPGKCKPCILGNQKRRPFDASVEPETEVLGRVMLDIWGPACSKSVGGSRYAMIFVDD
ncbi:hypothetical protein EDD85DRAFT_730654, partial [Armillaria nabsnona]